MKYLKTYEDVGKPQIGDYVICKDSQQDATEITKKFLSKNIGIVRSCSAHGGIDIFLVQYDNIPKELFDYFCFDCDEPPYTSQIDNTKNTRCRHFYIFDIIFFSKSKLACELYWETKMFNL